MISVRNLLLAPALAVMLSAAPASATTLKYSGEGFVVGVFGNGPGFINFETFPFTWLTFEMAFDSMEGPVASTATTATYEAQSGAVFADDLRFRFVSATLEITRDEFAPIPYSYVFIGVTPQGWIMRFDSSAEDPELVPDLQLPTSPATHVDHFTTILLQEGKHERWRAFSDRTTLFSVEEWTLVSNGTWENLPLPSQVDFFTILYDVTPGVDHLNAVTGVSDDDADSQTDLAAIIRFAPSGFIDAFNGDTGAYEAVDPLSYEAGVRYTVAMNVNFFDQTYSATVTPTGGAPVWIAEEHVFRSEQTGVLELDNLALHSQGGVCSIANVEIVSPGPP